MKRIRHAVEFTVDCDVAFEDDATEIYDLIEEALSAWKPTITYAVREYTTD